MYNFRIQNHYSPNYHKLLYSPNPYPNQSYIPNIEFYHLTSNNRLNINSYSQNNSLKSLNPIPPEISLIPVSRHNSNHFNYVSRTPSPPPKKNIIAFNDSRQFKRLSNFQTNYSKNGYDSINDGSFSNQTIQSENYIPLYQNSNNYFHSHNIALRMIPKTNNKNIIDINIGKNRQNYSQYIDTRKNLFGFLEPNESKIQKLNKTNKNNHVPNNFNNNGLKTNNLIIKNFNINGNHNNINVIKNTQFFNQNNNYQTLNNVMNINRSNNHNRYNNRIINGVNHIRHLSVDSINIISNIQNYNNLNITDRVNHNYYNSRIMTDNTNSSERANHIYQNSIENHKNDTIDMYTNNNYNPKNTMVNINGSDNNYNNTNNMTDNNIRRAFINIPKRHHYIYKINNPIKTLKIHTNNMQNHINIIPVPKSKHCFLSGENDIKKKELLIKNSVPGDDFNPHEFNILQQIGKGGFGKIYSVRWSKNNKIYALKKIHLTKDEILLYRNKVKIIQNLVKKTGHNGFIKIYGDKCIKQNDLDEYNYYIIMELGERDWLKELKMREECQLYYTEYELLGIALQLIKSLTIMQNHNITHRDIKPQNILLIKGAFKICDFGEVKIINGNGSTLLPIGGSELYMSPILYYAVKNKQEKVLHNTYKSDVFSLGMCLLLAAGFSRKLLLDIRKIKDMNNISEIIQNALNSKYSQKFISLIITMLQIDENLRFDFNELQRYISNNFHC